MRIRWIIVVSLLLAATLSTRVSAERDSGQLPAPLLFTAAKDMLHAPASLVYIDPKTLAMTPFYVDQTAIGVGLRALRWSPNGDLLAIFRSQQTNTAASQIDATYLDQICILTRAGISQVCFQEPPTGEHCGKNRFHWW